MRDDINLQVKNSRTVAPFFKLFSPHDIDVQKKKTFTFQDVLLRG